MKLSETDFELFAWQLDLPGLGEAGQAKLRNTTALVSRVGGLGGPVALSLAAAGFGKIILAHGGSLRPDDLNRQILMAHGSIGQPRAEIAAETLRRFTPAPEIEAIPQNIIEENAAHLVSKVDVIFDCAPLFSERFLMNREAVRQNKLLLDTAMYGMEGRLLTVIPGQTACLACLYPETPPAWKRRFPVLGAVPALLANLAVIEAVKLLTGMPGASAGDLLHLDATNLTLRRLKIARRPDCKICSPVAEALGL